MVCTARTGSPAKNEYELELVYLPPEWIEHNLTNITDENPQGTGEYDFAILKSSGESIGAQRVTPIHFHTSPHLTRTRFRKLAPFSSRVPTLQDSCGVITCHSTMLQHSTVNQLFTFGTSTQAVDLFGLEGTILAQKVLLVVQ